MGSGLPAGSRPAWRFTSNPYETRAGVFLKSQNKKGLCKAKAILRLDGFEPSTLSLKVRCSTTELKSRVDPDGIRTRVIGMKIRCPRPG